MSISSGLGNALVPTSYGFRNEIINGNFMINQRGYTSGSNLASGAYGFDRWKSAFTNTSLIFTSAPQGQLVTISASGVIQQVIEQANIVAGSYVLSWSGTARGRVYNSGASAPAYQSGPFSVVLDGTANVVVEFTPASGTATLGNVQLELGSRATPFEQRLNSIELMLCQRYYEKSYNIDTAPGANSPSGFVLAMPGGAQAGSSGIHDAGFTFKVTKRTDAAVTIYDMAGNANRCRRTAVGVANYDNQDVRDVVANTNSVYFRSQSGSGSTNQLSCHYVASAEL